jgi:CRISPR/Cas system-associated endonuclease Cas1
VTDSTSGKEVWQALVSQKLRDPQKFLNDLNKNIDNVMSKALKGFPPGTKRK